MQDTFLILLIITILISLMCRNCINELNGFPFRNDLLDAPAALVYSSVTTGRIFGLNFCSEGIVNRGGFFRESELHAVMP